MRRYLAISLLLPVLGACHKDAATPESPSLETADWYALKSPNNREIVAMAGDIDTKLTIATPFNVYLTTDRGKSWQTSNYPAKFGIFGLATQGDTLLALTSKASLLDTSTIYASYPSYYSLDQGITWQDYRFASTAKALTGLQIPLNRVHVPNGHTYRIGVQQISTSPSAASKYIITTGIQPDNAPLIKLPQEHQIYSLRLDQQARLYVAASAPLKGQGKDFAFLGDTNGILYVSKRALN